MTLWKCYYHLIWATNQRSPVLDDRREAIFRSVTVAASREMGVLIHDIGVIEDHVHLAASIPPRLAVSDVLQRIKGSSSRALGEGDMGAVNRWPGWQQEYGVLTFGERSLADVATYVRDQKMHHAAGTILKPYELIDRRDAT